MDQNLEDKLVKRFPLIFKDYRGDMRQTCMVWGFECGNGWFDLLYDLCLDLEYLSRGKNIEIIAVQVKEKFGGLRFYYTTRQPETIFSELSRKFQNWMFNHKYGVAYWKLVHLKEKILWKSIETKIENRVNKAEQDSYKICEQCGAPGKQMGKFWIYTMCNKCAKEKGVFHDQESIDEESEEND